MNTKINLTYKGVSYCLEYDRMSVKMLEANGFAVEEILQRVVLLLGGYAAHLQRPNGRDLTHTGRTITNLLANLKHFQFLLFQSRSSVCSRTEYSK